MNFTTMLTIFLALWLFGGSDGVGGIERSGGSETPPVPTSAP